MKSIFCSSSSLLIVIEDMPSYQSFVINYSFYDIIEIKKKTLSVCS